MTFFSVNMSCDHNLFCALFHGWIKQAEMWLLLCSKPEVKGAPLHVDFDATIWRLHDRRYATNVQEEY